MEHRENLNFFINLIDCNKQPCFKSWHPFILKIKSLQAEGRGKYEIYKKIRVCSYFGPPVSKKVTLPTSLKII